MAKDLGIRESGEDDLAAIEALYPRAFPEEDLLPIVRDLLNDPGVALSFVATTGRRVSGHVIFTRCRVGASFANAALLGPLAVAPEWQGQGIGTALVRAGIRQLKAANVNQVYVLGDPAYYSRLGFIPEPSVEPPYPLPAEWDGAWQSQALGESETTFAGTLSVPDPWMRRTLWAP